MYDPERGWSFSFAGCGFLGFYHVGATRCLSERAPHLLRDARMFFGCSSGALHCATFLGGIPLDRTIQILVDIIRHARKWNFGILSSSLNLSKYIRENLNKHLPANIHQLVSGKMCLSLTRVSDGKNVLVSDFQSKEEVVDRYIDGAFTDIMPFADATTTITVSPFYGKHSICPKVKSTNFLHVNIKKLSLCLCSENTYLVFRVLFPTDVKALGEICLRGYLDALRFLEEQSICTRPETSLNLSSEERESEVTAPCWENMSLEAPWEAAALDTRLIGNELLEALRCKLNIEESDAAKSGRDGPEQPEIGQARGLDLPQAQAGSQATIYHRHRPPTCSALREAMKGRGGYMSKMRTLFPLRTLSCVMLPCTLPVEPVTAFVQRLVMCFLYILDGMQWATTQIYSQVMPRLLPTSRSQTPAPDHQAFAHEPEHDRCCWPPDAPLSLDAYSVDCPVGPKSEAAQ